MTSDRPIRGSARLAAAAMLAVAVLAACASTAPTAPSSTSTSAAASSPGSGTAVASGPVSGGASSGPAGVGGTTTLTGTIAAGVESGCLVLTDKSGAVLANLQGLDPTTVTFAVEVAVTGTFEDMMTTCMQGKPFAVTSVLPK